MVEKELSKGRQLEKELCWEYPNIVEKAPEQREKAHKFAKGYMKFFGACKTECECVDYVEKFLLEASYERLDSKKKYKAGGKVFSTNRGRAVVITVFGKKLIAEGVRISGAHIDSPRIDLRPNPPYESNGVALSRTHYYGGIKKYQWGTILLVMHGAVARKDGTTVETMIGEDPSDPVLYITDLLIHLAKQQMQRTPSEGLRAEELNTVLSTMPYPDNSMREPLRSEVFRYLNEKYGVTEYDFVRAEIEFVPADKSCDIGFDRSLIGGYGQDDRVCAYAVLWVQLDTVNPEYTTVTILTGKEEIGLRGTTGSKSNFLYDYICYLMQMEGVDMKDAFAKSACFSADANSAYDPTFVGVLEAENSSHLNRGAVLTKCTGSGGKFGMSDASAEFMAEMIDIMDKNGVYWQIGELGKLDLGGGDTVVGDAVRLNVDVVDLGVAVLSMHSPFEVTSKLDNYDMYLAFKAFYPEV